MKIEGMCKCGLWQYGHWGDAPVGEWYCDWQKRYLIDGYCHVCGYHLAYNGFAYQMVRADRAAELEKELAEMRVDRDNLESILDSIKTDGGIQFGPAEQEDAEGSDE